MENKWIVLLTGQESFNRSSLVEKGATKIESRRPNKAASDSYCGNPITERRVEVFLARKFLDPMVTVRDQ